MVSVAQHSMQRQEKNWLHNVFWVNERVDEVGLFLMN